MPDDDFEYPRPAKRPLKKEKLIPSVYPVLDNDLARDNVENVRAGRN